MTKKELNKIITKELKRFGIRKAKIAQTFCFYYEDNTIDYCITPGIEDKYFSDFLKLYFDYDDTKTAFLVSLLHEVGHHLNNDDVVGETYAFCLGQKYKISEDLISAGDDDTLRKLNYKYFSLPDEIMATSWAINYIRNHPKQAKKMNKRINRAIKEYNITGGI